MNEPQNLKEHQISKQTQIRNQLLILKHDQISNETQITNNAQMMY